MEGQRPLALSCGDVRPQRVTSVNFKVDNYSLNEELVGLTALCAPENNNKRQSKSSVGARMLAVAWESQEMSSTSLKREMVQRIKGIDHSPQKKTKTTGCRGCRTDD